MRLGVWTSSGNLCFCLNKTVFEGAGGGILFLFNLERGAEEGKEMVFTKIDSYLGAASQSFPLALHVSGIPLLGMGGAYIPCSREPRSLSSSSALSKGQLKQWCSRVGADSIWKGPFPDPAESMEQTRAAPLEPWVLLPMTGVVSWIGSSRLVGARSLAGGGSE